MPLIKTVLTVFTGLLCAVMFQNCSHRTILTSDAWAEKAIDVPDHFMVGKTHGYDMEAPTPGKDCRNPMIDPRDSTKIILVRSFDGRGDYEVPDGKYGVKKGQILRLDCNNGKVVGIFKH